jgi:hypothetical protein
MTQKNDKTIMYVGIGVVVLAIAYFTRKKWLPKKPTAKPKPTGLPNPTSKGAMADVVGAVNRAELTKKIVTNAGITEDFLKSFTDRELYIFDVMTSSKPKNEAEALEIALKQGVTKEEIKTMGEKVNKLMEQAFSKI